MTTLQSYIATMGPSSADLQPLAANETYRRAVDAELAAREASAAAAAAVAERTEDLYSGVRPFATAMSAIRAVAKRFPETSKHMDDAAKSVQAAMGIVAYNPPTLTPAAQLPGVGSDPTKTKTDVKPLPTVTATGATPTAPVPPAPPAPPLAHK